MDSPEALESPPLRLDVVNVRVLPLLYGRHDLPNVDTVLDHRVARLHVLQRDLVADRNVLHARQRDRAVFIQDQAGERGPRLDALDDDDGDRIFRIVQYAVNHFGLLLLSTMA